ncbi:hypothetical protein WMF37_39790 [Sorangium sp. So ce291]|uniref:hypothetical protein n=1 Tax=Sorangium sp. So ce291 TaxID=3133294 RepID=UPI003F5FE5CA
MAKMKKAWSVVLVMVVAGVAGAAALPSEAIAEGQCNGKSKPCPLQKWMRDNAGTPMASGELATIATSMEKAIKYGGPDMKDWAKLAKKTSDDARANKTDDVKADCKACHDAYKDAYKQNAALRNKPIP